MKAENAIWLVLLLSLMFSLYGLGDKSLWFDEAFTAQALREGFGDMMKTIYSDVHPPLYYAFMKLWTGIFGYSEYALRLPSAIFGVACVYLSCLLGRSWYDGKTGLLAALLLSLSGLFLRYCQEARMYTMFTMFALLTLYFFTKRNWQLFALSAILGIYTHFMGFVVILIVLVHSAIKKEVSGYLVLSCIIIAVAGLPLLPIITNAWSMKQAETWGMLADIHFVPRYLGLFLGGGELLGLLFFCFFVRQIIRTKKALPLLWVAIPLIFGFALAFFIPVSTTGRYFLFVLPAYLVVIASSILSMKKGYLTVIMLLIVIDVSAVSLLAEYSREKTDWRGATAYVDSNVLPGDGIAVEPGWAGDAFRYYSKNELRPGNRIWVIQLDDAPLNYPGYAAVSEREFTSLRVRILQKT
ncbi:MAG: glycosyltransferase family 39 protein [archaeon]